MVVEWWTLGLSGRGGHRLVHHSAGLKPRRENQVHMGPTGHLLEPETGRSSLPPRFVGRSERSFRPNPMNIMRTPSRSRPLVVSHEHHPRALTPHNPARRMIFEMWNSAFQRSAAPVARGEGLRCARASGFGPQDRPPLHRSDHRVGPWPWIKRKPTWTTPSWPRWASWPGRVAPTATGRAGRCSKRRGIEACPKLSRASSCLFLGRSRSTSLRHPRFPRIGGFHEQRPPVTGIILLSPGNASRLGLDRMRFISFHVVSEGGLEGLLPPPRGFVVGPELWLPAA